MSSLTFNFICLIITIARDSITGGTKLACTQVGTSSIFFKSLIILDYGFKLTKTVYLNVFRNWNVLCKSTLLYKSCSTPAGNKRKKTINTAFASQHVPLKNRVSDF